MTRKQKVQLRTFLCNHSGEFHHGDCIGSDAEAHDIAEELGFEIDIHPPDNPSKRAYKIPSPGIPVRDKLPYLVRNKNIVRATDQLFAAPGEDTEQLRSGTWSTIRFARKLGKPITIFFPNGSIVHEP